LQFRFVHRVLGAIALVVEGLAWSLPSVSAQSPQVTREWALFDQILMIGIVVGIVVFGLMFYALIRYREKPQKAGAQ
jgi:heme/copper-type cytochrome/quinol oxidase subunit 2